MMEDEQNLKENTGKGPQTKMSKKSRQITDTGQKVYKKIQDLLVYS